MVTNDHENRSSVTAMLKCLEWPTLEHRCENQRLTIKFKVVRGLLAVLFTHLIPADHHTRAKHQFKFRNITTNSTPYKYSFFLRTIPSWGNFYRPTWSTLRHSTRRSRIKSRLPEVASAHHSIGVIFHWEFADYITETEAEVGYGIVFGLYCL